MITKKLIFSAARGVNIYEITTGEFLLEERDYAGSIREKSSLLALLKLFQSPVSEILASIKDEKFRIEEILPLNELLIFLLTEMKSSFWMNLVCNFLLNDLVNARLHITTLNSLRDPELLRWLPQKELHLVRKLVKRHVHFWR